MLMAAHLQHQDVSQAAKCQLQPNQGFRNVLMQLFRSRVDESGVDLQELQHGLAHVRIQAISLQQLLLQPYRLPQVCA